MGVDGCLYDCESEEEFNQKSEAFKTKWENIERSSTQNNPPMFCTYFIRYKEKQIREKMTKKSVIVQEFREALVRTQ
jgi:hypothetical protein